MKTITLEVLNTNATDCPIKISDGKKSDVLWIESDAWKSASVVLDRIKMNADHKGVEMIDHATICDTAYSYPILVACLNGSIPNK